LGGGRVKRPGHEADHHFHPVPRSRMVELYLYFPIHVHDIKHWDNFTFIGTQFVLKQYSGDGDSFLVYLRTVS
jgi:hypothetical protein